MTTTGSPTKTRAAGPTLSRRASLNALAALVDYGARIGVSLMLAPLMLRFLGVGGYGVWQVVLRLVGQATPAGGRPGEALKWVIAHGQGSDDDERKRQQVGTALVVWALFLPLVTVLGTVLVWLAPALVHASTDDVGTVRAAAALLLVNLIVLGLASLPQAVLQGQNLGYRRLGLSTAVLLVGGGLTTLALWLGWGLPGVALATIATTCLSGVTYLSVVRRHVPWWGVARPPRGAVRGFVGLSWWFLLWNLVMQVVKNSDVILLGAVAGTALVTTYVLTSYVPQTVTDLTFMTVSATMPGLGGLVGGGELARAARVRGETLALSWLLAVASGATVVVWLPDFLALWVGAEYDAGLSATVLICVMVLQLALIRVDANVIDLTLQIRGKVLLGLFSAVLAVALGVVLVGPAGWGIPGLVVAFIAGRLPLTVAYPLLVGRLLAVPLRAQVAASWRPGLISAAMFAVAVWLRPLAAADDWLSFLAMAAGTGALMLAVAYVVGLPSGPRRRLRRRVAKVVSGS